MLTIKTGSIFDSAMDILVCPVNCIPGVMGAGLAKQFCFEFGEGRMKSEHRISCSVGMKVGVPWFAMGQKDRRGRDKGILFFPTKHHWKNPSKIEWISDGLDRLFADYDRYCVTSVEPWPTIAFPPLGCGLGGLKEEDVLPLIERFANRYESECEYYRQ